MPYLSCHGLCSRVRAAKAYATHCAITHVENSVVNRLRHHAANSKNSMYQICCVVEQMTTLVANPCYPPADIAPAAARKCHPPHRRPHEQRGEEDQHRAVEQGPCVGALRQVAFCIARPLSDQLTTAAANTHTSQPVGCPSSYLHTHSRNCCFVQAQHAILMRPFLVNKHFSYQYHHDTIGAYQSARLPVI